jgi:hypothetical protein
MAKHGLVQVRDTRQFPFRVRPAYIDSVADKGKLKGFYIRWADINVNDEMASAGGWVPAHEIQTDLDVCSWCGSLEHEFSDCLQNPISAAKLQEWFDYEGRDPRAY